MSPELAIGTLLGIAIQHIIDPSRQNAREYGDRSGNTDPCNIDKNSINEKVFALVEVVLLKIQLRTTCSSDASSAPFSDGDPRRNLLVR